jgi:hypothetical protein
VGQHQGFVRFAVYISLLDTGLRRYDGSMDNLGLLKMLRGTADNKLLKNPGSRIAIPF